VSSTHCRFGPTSSDRRRRAAVFCLLPWPAQLGAGGTIEDRIAKGDPTCSVTPYSVTYDGLNTQSELLCWHPGAGALALAETLANLCAPFAPAAVPSMTDSSTFTAPEGAQAMRGLAI
jgi:hypothetical protein